MVGNGDWVRWFVGEHKCAYRGVDGVQKNNYVFTDNTRAMCILPFHKETSPSLLTLPPSTFLPPPSSLLTLPPSLPSLPPYPPSLLTLPPSLPFLPPLIHTLTVQWQSWRPGHPSQSSSGGVWKCQDYQERQLITFCKLCTRNSSTQL